MDTDGTQTAASVDQGTQANAAPAPAPTNAAQQQPTADAGGTSFAKELPGDDFAAKLDALFARTFNGTRMGNDTELWNQCVGFREDVKTLAAQV